MNKIIAVVITLTICLFIGFSIIQSINNGFTDFYSRHFVSGNIKESIDNKIFRKTITVIPKQINIEGQIVKFKECWIEEQTQEVHNFIFFKSKRYLKIYNLCLTLECPNDFGKRHFIVEEDLHEGFSYRGFNKENNLLLTKTLKKYSPIVLGSVLSKTGRICVGKT
jgi:hypothetical protein